MALSGATSSVNVERTSHGRQVSEARARFLTLKGYAASSGIAAGPCTIASSVEELAGLAEGAILVCESASPRLIPVIGKLKALVTEKGGTLADASGYAREYSIPAVVGVAGLMKAIRNGAIIRVDGTEGTVDIII